jgi:hypothetical protein
VTAYLHNNPVKAGMVKHPGNYKWSSYKDYISGKGDGVVDKNILDRYFHMAPLEYEAYVLSELKNDNDVMSDIYAGCILGKKQFIDNILRERKIEVKNGEISFRKKIKGTGPADISIDEIGDMVASEFGVNSIDLYKNANIPMVERKAGIYLTKELTGLSNAKIGEKYGISYSAVSKAWKSFACEMEDGGIVEKVGRIISHFKG